MTERPVREDIVLRYVLERLRQTQPEKPIFRLGSGAEITYGAFTKDVEVTAAALARLGVEKGQTVTVWMPNGPDTVRVWFAINWLGAIYVPINTAYRGGVLEHVLANAGSQLMVASAALVPRLAEVDRAALQTIVIFGDAPAPIAGLRYEPSSVLEDASATLPPLAAPIEPWDPQLIVYTSGTTGRSKGVLCNYIHHAESTGPQSWFMVTPEDTFLVLGPLCHVGGTLPVIASLLRGACIGMAGEFTTETFWPVVNATKATLAILLGVTSSFISKRPPSPVDRDHTLKNVSIIPLGNESKAFAERFGVDVWTLFNMSETSMPIISRMNPDKPATCGHVRPAVTARIVDENDLEVPVGQTGELVLRGEPWTLNTYWKDDAATLRAWRNGWFHTGDAFKRDADGDYFFVDRMKDAIRRRGENISSFEVELEVVAHPLVRECAVVAVPSEVAEDEVLAVVAPVEGAVIDPIELLEFLRPRLAHFMLPRFIRIVPELPRTSTQKIEKHVLRAQGVTADVWDRDVAGVKVRREKI